jgi:hypothetical protein
MSEVLARIRVRETAGIRRFLYPLQAKILVPNCINPSAFGMTDQDGHPVPNQMAPIYLGNDIWSQEYTLDFAVSLEPFDEREFIVADNRPQIAVEDPLQITTTSQHPICSIQRKFSVELDWDGFISMVAYDGIPHLRKPMEISRNGNVVEQNESGVGDQRDQLKQTIKASGIYDADMCDYKTTSEITACKSWVTVTHTLEQPKPNDEIIFTLPLAVTSKTLTCDFGVGGYVFGKLDSKATEIVWRTEFGDTPYAKWTVATAGRVDYVGEVDSAEAFLPQRWFHLIDSDKALAVAITKLPAACQSLTVRLTIEGDVSIAFKLGDTVSGPAEFGVCYHFLNDVPAIAAATNPQSILLPPTVEVLPV